MIHRWGSTQPDFESESYNLKHVADAIKEPTGSRLVWLGDSTGATTATPRWGMSIARGWDIAIAGRTFYSTSSLSLENAYLTFGASGLTKKAGETLDGVTVPAGFTARYKTWSSNVDFSGVIRQVATLQDYKQGHPLVGENYRVNLALLGTDNPLERCFANYRDSAAGMIDSLSLQFFGLIAGNGQWQKYSMPTRSTIEVGDTSFGPDIITSNSENETGKHFVQGGWEWEAVGKAGLTYSSISVGGHGAIDHAEVGTEPTSKYSFEERKNKFDVFGWPGVIAVQLGINKVVDVRGLWGTQIRHILDWHVQLYNDNGHTPPKFMLVVPWPTSSDVGVNLLDDEAKELIEICDERTDCGVLNLYRRMLNVHGPYDDWQATYLADGVHQSTVGAIEFGEQSWSVIENA